MMKRYLLKLAKDAILEELSGKKLIDKGAWVEAYPELAKEGAAFVTLKKEEALRGCIGSLVAHRPLIDDIIANAKSAAFRDPRFSSLSADELQNLSIEVSILSHPKKLPYHDIEDLRQKLRKGVDGVILKMGTKEATFLPQVWEQLPQFDAFFAHLCQKAGFDIECIKKHPEIYTYQVEKIKE
jgi:AmmeMemoRadiSam system protein A